MASVSSENSQANNLVQLQEQGGAIGALPRGEHGHEGEDHGVDEHGIQRVQRAHGHGQGIRLRVRAQQVGSQGHAYEADDVAGDDARPDGQPAAHQRALHRPSQDSFGKDRGWRIRTQSRLKPREAGRLPTYDAARAAASAVS